MILPGRYVIRAHHDRKDERQGQRELLVVLSFSSLKGFFKSKGSMGYTGSQGGVPHTPPSDSNHSRNRDKSSVCKCQSTK